MLAADTTDTDVDAELARRIAGGAAPDAEAEFARRFAPRIRLYGLRHLRDEDRARDLVQDVLIAVLQAVRGGRLEDPARLGRFVLGACRNIVSGWRRGAGRHEAATAVLSAEAEAVCLPPRGPTDVLRLMGCLDGLAAREQNVLLLTYCEERSAEEIGAALGLSTGNVRVVRHRALAQVKGCVESPAGRDA